MTKFKRSFEAEERYQNKSDLLGLPDKESKIWINDAYTVFVRELEPSNDSTTPMIWLSIKRNDQAPIFDWRDLQQIKNELAGKDYEGVQLFPAHDRTVDSSNQYHIWVIKDKHFRFPFGFSERMVIDNNAFVSNVGAKQRKIEHDI